ncbi:hypothetical protein DID77_00005, partial [Candidatus Marinamargulisbacteria bacterium SCGC AG-439-L15]
MQSTRFNMLDFIRSRLVSQEKWADPDVRIHSEDPSVYKPQSALSDFSIQETSFEFLDRYDDVKIKELSTVFLNGLNAKQALVIKELDFLMKKQQLSADYDVSHAARILNQVYSPLIFQDSLSVKAVVNFYASILLAFIQRYKKKDLPMISTIEANTIFNQYMMGIRYQDQDGKTQLLLPEYEMPFQDNPSLYQMVTSFYPEREVQGQALLSSVDYENAHAYLDTESESVHQLITTIFDKDLQRLSSKEIVQTIHTYMLNEFRYQSDRQESWASVSETIKTKRGDCEDLTNVEASLLKTALNLAGKSPLSDAIYVVAGKSNSQQTEVGHTFVVFKDEEGQEWVLDPTDMRPVRSSSSIWDTQHLLKTVLSDTNFKVYFKYTVGSTSLLVDKILLNGFVTASWEAYLQNTQNAVSLINHWDANNVFPGGLQSQVDGLTFYEISTDSNGDPQQTATNLGTIKTEAEAYKQAILDDTANYPAFATGSSPSGDDFWDKIVKVLTEDVLGLGPGGWLSEVGDAMAGIDMDPDITQYTYMGSTKKFYTEYDSVRENPPGYGFSQMATQTYKSEKEYEEFSDNIDPTDYFYSGGSGVNKYVGQTESGFIVYDFSRIFRDFSRVIDAQQWSISLLNAVFSQSNMYSYIGSSLAAETEPSPSVKGRRKLAKSLQSAYQSRVSLMETFISNNIEAWDEHNDSAYQEYDTTIDAHYSGILHTLGNIFMIDHYTIIQQQLKKLLSAEYFAVIARIREGYQRASSYLPQHTALWDSGSLSTRPYQAKWWANHQKQIESRIKDPYSYIPVKNKSTIASSSQSYNINDPSTIFNDRDAVLQFLGIYNLTPSTQVTNVYNTYSNSGQTWLPVGMTLNEFHRQEQFRVLCGLLSEVEYLSVSSRQVNDTFFKELTKSYREYGVLVPEKFFDKKLVINGITRQDTFRDVLEGGASLGYRYVGTTSSGHPFSVAPRPTLSSTGLAEKVIALLMYASEIDFLTPFEYYFPWYARTSSDNFAGYQASYELSDVSVGGTTYKQFDGFEEHVNGRTKFLKKSAPSMSGADASGATKYMRYGTSYGSSSYTGSNFLYDALQDEHHDYIIVQRDSTDSRDSAVSRVFYIDPNETIASYIDLSTRELTRNHYETNYRNKYDEFNYKSSPAWKYFQEKGLSFHNHFDTQKGYSVRQSRFHRDSFVDIENTLNGIDYRYLEAPNNPLTSDDIWRHLVSHTYGTGSSESDYGVGNEVLVKGEFNATDFLRVGLQINQHLGLTTGAEKVDGNEIWAYLRDQGYINQSHATRTDMWTNKEYQLTNKFLSNGLTVANQNTSVGVGNTNTNQINLAGQTKIAAALTAKQAAITAAGTASAAAELQQDLDDCIRFLKKQEYIIQEMFEDAVYLNRDRTHHFKTFDSMTYYNSTIGNINKRLLDGMSLSSGSINDVKSIIFERGQLRENWMYDYFELMDDDGTPTVINEEDGDNIKSELDVQFDGTPLLDSSAVMDAAADGAQEGSRRSVENAQGFDILKWDEIKWSNNTRLDDVTFNGSSLGSHFGANSSTLVSATRSWLLANTGLSGPSSNSDLLNAIRLPFSAIRAGIGYTNDVVVSSSESRHFGSIAANATSSVNLTSAQYTGRKFRREPSQHIQIASVLGVGGHDYWYHPYTPDIHFRTEQDNSANSSQVRLSVEQSDYITFKMILDNKKMRLEETTPPASIQIFDLNDNGSLGSGTPPTFLIGRTGSEPDDDIEISGTGYTDPELIALIDGSDDSVYNPAISGASTKMSKFDPGHVHVASGSSISVNGSPELMQKALYDLAKIKVETNPTDITAMERIFLLSFFEMSTNLSALQQAWYDNNRTPDPSSEIRYPKDYLPDWSRSRGYSERLKQDERYAMISSGESELFYNKGHWGSSVNSNLWWKAEGPAFVDSLEMEVPPVLHYFSGTSFSSIPGVSSLVSLDIYNALQTDNVLDGGTLENMPASLTPTVQSVLVNNGIDPAAAEPYLLSKLGESNSQAFLNEYFGERDYGDPVQLTINASYESSSGQEKNTYFLMPAWDVFANSNKSMVDRANFVRLYYFVMTTITKAYQGISKNLNPLSSANSDGIDMDAQSFESRVGMDSVRYNHVVAKTSLLTSQQNEWERSRITLEKLEDTGRRVARGVSLYSNLLALIIFLFAPMAYAVGLILMIVGMQSDVAAAAIDAQLSWLPQKMSDHPELKLNTLLRDQNHYLANISSARDTFKKLINYREDFDYSSLGDHIEPTADKTDTLYTNFIGEFTHGPKGYFRKMARQYGISTAVSDTQLNSLWDYLKTSGNINDVGKIINSGTLQTTIESQGISTTHATTLATILNTEFGTDLEVVKLVHNYMSAYPGFTFVHDNKGEKWTKPSEYSDQSQPSFFGDCEDFALMEASLLIQALQKNLNPNSTDNQIDNSVYRTKVFLRAGSALTDVNNSGSEVGHVVVVYDPSGGGGASNADLEYSPTNPRTNTRQQYILDPTDRTSNLRGIVYNYNSDVSSGGDFFTDDFFKGMTNDYGGSPLSGTESILLKRFLTDYTDLLYNIDQISSNNINELRPDELYFFDDIALASFGWSNINTYITASAPTGLGRTGYDASQQASLNSLFYNYGGKIRHSMLSYKQLTNFRPYFDVIKGQSNTRFDYGVREIELYGFTTTFFSNVTNTLGGDGDRDFENISVYGETYNLIQSRGPSYVEYNTSTTGEYRRVPYSQLDPSGNGRVEFGNTTIYVPVPTYGINGVVLSESPSPVSFPRNGGSHGAAQGSHSDYSNAGSAESRFDEKSKDDEADGVMQVVTLGLHPTVTTDTSSDRNPNRVSTAPSDKNISTNYHPLEESFSSGTQGPASGTYGLAPLRLDPLLPEMPLIVKNTYEEREVLTQIYDMAFDNLTGSPGSYKHGSTSIPDSSIDNETYFNNYLDIETGDDLGLTLEGLPSASQGHIARQRIAIDWPRIQQLQHKLAKNHYWMKMLYSSIKIKVDVILTLAAAIKGGHKTAITHHADTIFNSQFQRTSDYIGLLQTVFSTIQEASFNNASVDSSRYQAFMTSLNTTAWSFVGSVLAAVAILPPFIWLAFFVPVIQMFQALVGATLNYYQDPWSGRYMDLYRSWDEKSAKDDWNLAGGTRYPSLLGSSDHLGQHHERYFGSRSGWGNAPLHGGLPQHENDYDHDFELIEFHEELNNSVYEDYRVTVDDFVGIQPNAVNHAEIFSYLSGQKVSSGTGANRSLNIYEYSLLTPQGKTGSGESSYNSGPHYFESNTYMKSDFYSRDKLDEALQDIHGQNQSLFGGIGPSNTANWNNLVSTYDDKIDSPQGVNFKVGVEEYLLEKKYHLDLQPNGETMYAFLNSSLPTGRHQSRGRQLYRDYGDKFNSWLKGRMSFQMLREQRVSAWSNYIRNISSMISSSQSVENVASPAALDAVSSIASHYLSNSGIVDQWLGAKEGGNALRFGADKLYDKALLEAVIMGLLILVGLGTAAKAGGSAQKMLATYNAVASMGKQISGLWFAIWDGFIAPGTQNVENYKTNTDGEDGDQTREAKERKRAQRRQKIRQQVVRAAAIGAILLTIFALAFGPLAKGMGRVMGKIGSAIKQGFKSVSGALGKVFGSIKSALQNMLKKIRMPRVQAALKSMGWIGRGFGKGVRALVNITKAIGRYLMKTFGKLASKIASSRLLGKFFYGLLVFGMVMIALELIGSGMMAARNEGQYGQDDAAAGEGIATTGATGGAGHMLGFQMSYVRTQELVKKKRQLRYLINRVKTMAFVSKSRAEFIAGLVEQLGGSSAGTGIFQALDRLRGFTKSVDDKLLDSRYAHYQDIVTRKNKIQDARRQLLVTMIQLYFTYKMGKISRQRAENAEIDAAMSAEEGSEDLDVDVNNEDVDSEQNVKAAVQAAKNSPTNSTVGEQQAAAQEAQTNEIQDLPVSNPIDPAAVGASASVGAISAFLNYLWEKVTGPILQLLIGAIFSAKLIAGAKEERDGSDGEGTSLTNKSGKQRGGVENARFGNEMKRAKSKVMKAIVGLVTNSNNEVAEAIRKIYEKFVEGMVDKLKNLASDGAAETVVKDQMFAAEIEAQKAEQKGNTEKAREVRQKTAEASLGIIGVSLGDSSASSSYPRGIGQRAHYAAKQVIGLTKRFTPEQYKSATGGKADLGKDISVLQKKAEGLGGDNQAMLRDIDQARADISKATQKTESVDVHGTQKYLQHMDQIGERFNVVQQAYSKLATIEEKLLSKSELSNPQQGKTTFKDRADNVKAAAASFHVGHATGIINDPTIPADKKSAQLESSSRYLKNNPDSGAFVSSLFQAHHQKRGDEHKEKAFMKNMVKLGRAADPEGGLKSAFVSFTSTYSRRADNFFYKNIREHKTAAALARAVSGGKSAPLLSVLEALEKNSGAEFVGHVINSINPNSSSSVNQMSRLDKKLFSEPKFIAMRRRGYEAMQAGAAKSKSQSRLGQVMSMMSEGGTRKSKTKSADKHLESQLKFLEKGFKADMAANPDQAGATRDTMTDVGLSWLSQSGDTLSKDVSEQLKRMSGFGQSGVPSQFESGLGRAAASVGMPGGPEAQALKNLAEEYVGGDSKRLDALLERTGLKNQLEESSAYRSSQMVGSIEDSSSRVDSLAGLNDAVKDNMKNRLNDLSNEIKELERTRERQKYDQDAAANKIKEVEEETKQAEEAAAQAISKSMVDLSSLSSSDIGDDDVIELVRDNIKKSHVDRAEAIREFEDILEQTKAKDEPSAMFIRDLYRATLRAIPPRDVMSAGPAPETRLNVGSQQATPFEQQNLNTILHYNVGSAGKATLLELGEGKVVKDVEGSEYDVQRQIDRAVRELNGTMHGPTETIIAQQVKKNMAESIGLMLELEPSEIEAEAGLMEVGAVPLDEDASFEQRMGRAIDTYTQAAVMQSVFTEFKDPNRTKTDQELCAQLSDETKQLLTEKTGKTDPSPQELLWAIPELMVSDPGLQDAVGSIMNRRSNLVEDDIDQATVTDEEVAAQSQKNRKEASDFIVSLMDSVGVEKGFGMLSSISDPKTKAEMFGDIVSTLEQESGINEQGKSRFGLRDVSEGLKTFVEQQPSFVPALISVLRAPSVEQHPDELIKTQAPCFRLIASLTDLASPGFVGRDLADKIELSLPDEISRIIPDIQETLRLQPNEETLGEINNNVIGKNHEELKQEILSDIQQSGFQSINTKQEAYLQSAFQGDSACQGAVRNYNAALISVLNENPTLSLDPYFKDVFKGAQETLYLTGPKSFSEGSIEGHDAMRDLVDASTKLVKSPEDNTHVTTMAVSLQRIVSQSDPGSQRDALLRDIDVLVASNESYDVRLVQLDGVMSNNQFKALTFKDDLGGIKDNMLVSLRQTQTTISDTVESSIRDAVNGNKSKKIVPMFQGSPQHASDVLSGMGDNNQKVVIKALERASKKEPVKSYQALSLIDGGVDDLNPKQRKDFIPSVITGIRDQHLDLATAAHSVSSLGLGKQLEMNKGDAASFETSLSNLQSAVTEQDKEMAVDEFAKTVTQLIAVPGEIKAALLATIAMPYVDALPSNLTSLNKMMENVTDPVIQKEVFSQLLPSLDKAGKQSILTDNYAQLVPAFIQSDPAEFSQTMRTLDQSQKEDIYSSYTDQIGEAFGQKISSEHDSFSTRPQRLKEAIELDSVLVGDPAEDTLNITADNCFVCAGVSLLCGALIPAAGFLATGTALKVMSKGHQLFLRDPDALDFKTKKATELTQIREEKSLAETNPDLMVSMLVDLGHANPEKLVEKMAELSESPKELNMLSKNASPEQLAALTNLMMSTDKGDAEKLRMAKTGLAVSLANENQAVLDAALKDPNASDDAKANLRETLKANLKYIPNLREGVLSVLVDSMSTVTESLPMLSADMLKRLQTAGVIDGEGRYSGQPIDWGDPNLSTLNLSRLEQSVIESTLNNTQIDYVMDPKNKSKLSHEGQELRAMVKIGLDKNPQSMRAYLTSTHVGHVQNVIQSSIEDSKTVQSQACLKELARFEGTIKEDGTYFLKSSQTAEVGDILGDSVESINKEDIISLRERGNSIKRRNTKLGLSYLQMVDSLAFQNSELHQANMEASVKELEDFDSYRTDSVMRFKEMKELLAETKINPQELAQKTVPEQVALLRARGEAIDKATWSVFHTKLGENPYFDMAKNLEKNEQSRFRGLATHYEFPVSQLGTELNAVFTESTAESKNDICDYYCLSNPQFLLDNFDRFSPDMQTAIKDRLTTYLEEDNVFLRGESSSVQARLTALSFGMPAASLGNRDASGKAILDVDIYKNLGTYLMQKALKGTISSQETSMLENLKEMKGQLPMLKDALGSASSAISVLGPLSETPINEISIQDAFSNLSVEETSRLMETLDFSSMPINTESLTKMKTLSECLKESLSERSIDPQKQSQLKALKVQVDKSGFIMTAQVTQKEISEVQSQKAAIYRSLDPEARAEMGVSDTFEGITKDEIATIQAKYKQAHLDFLEDSPILKSRVSAQTPIDYGTVLHQWSEESKYNYHEAANYQEASSWIGAKYLGFAVLTAAVPVAGLALAVQDKAPVYKKAKSLAGLSQKDGLTHSQKTADSTALLKQLSDAPLSFSGEIGKADKFYNTSHLSFDKGMAHNLPIVQNALNEGDSSQLQDNFNAISRKLTEAHQQGELSLAEFNTYIDTIHSEVSRLSTVSASKQVTPFSSAAADTTDPNSPKPSSPEDRGLAWGAYANFLTNLQSNSGL